MPCRDVSGILLTVVLDYSSTNTESWLKLFILLLVRVLLYNEKSILIDQ